MDQSNPNFFMILPSNSCSDTQPENNAADFIIEENVPLNFAERWQVALTEFKCNFPIYTLPKGIKISIEKVDAPLGTITKDKIEFANPEFNKYFKFIKENEKITIKCVSCSTFVLRFLSLADALKVGFEYDEVSGFEKIRANNIHTLRKNEQITFRLFIFIYDPNDDKRETTHRLFNDRIESTKDSHLKDSIDFDKTDEIITLSLRHKYVTQFALRFKNVDDARKVGFTSEYRVSRGHMTAKFKHSIKDGEYVDLHLFNPFTSIPRDYKEYILTDIDRYFPSSSLLVNYLNNLNLPIKFLLVKGKIKIIFNYKIHRIDFSYPLQYILGFQKKFIPNEEYTAEFKPLLNRAYGDINIYSSIVEPSYVGKTLTPLLKSFNIDKSLKFGEELTYIIPTPIYTNVTRSITNQIRINIRNHNGNYIPFAESAVTTLTLHFKKI